MRTNYWVLILALLGISGCDGMLTESPRGTLTTEGFYRTAADAEAAIAAVYQPLSTGALYGSGYKSGLILTSDLAWAGPFEETASIVALSRMNYDSETPRVTDHWGAFYTIITRANLLLEKLPQVEMNEAGKARIAGEAKFLRAFSYFSLVRLHGDVPLVTTTEEQLAPSTRTPAAAVFEQIIRDAQEAEAALPLTWNGGRATKGAAQTLLADVYLWRSSANGTNEWQQAADQARKVIDSDVYALEPDYLDAFLPGSESRSEEIFAAQASDVTGTPRIRTADMFYPRAMGPGGGAGGWGAMVPVDWHYDSYPDNDYRKDVTFFTSGRHTTGELVTFPPHIHKYRPSNHPATRDVNWPIYRYAEVLLYYAEALNELNRTAEAVQYLNMIRARARNGEDGAGGEDRSQPADYAGPLSQAAVRDTIFAERRLEMAYEGDRWFDLVRRGWDFFSSQLANDPTATDVQETDMLWPIPQEEIDLNPELVQNPGY